MCYDNIDVVIHSVGTTSTRIVMLIVQPPSDYSQQLPLKILLPSRPKVKAKSTFQGADGQADEPRIKDDLMGGIKQGRFILLSKEMVVRVLGQPTIQILIVFRTKAPDPFVLGASHGIPLVIVVIGRVMAVVAKHGMGGVVASWTQVEGVFPHGMIQGDPFLLVEGTGQLAQYDLSLVTQERQLIDKEVHANITKVVGHNRQTAVTGFTKVFVQPVQTHGVYGTQSKAIVIGELHALIGTQSDEIPGKA